MRIFLTGWSGFIGQAVMKALSGHELHLLEHDLRDVSKLKVTLRGARPEVCVHLAWEGLPDFSLTRCKWNYDLTAGLFDLLDCKVVGVGSCFEYGDLQGCVKEDDSPANLSYFAATKTALRLYGERRFGDRFVWVRPFYVYGPGQRKDALIPSAYAAMRAGEERTLDRPGMLCDFVHVDDVAACIAGLVTFDVPGGVYNLGTGVPWTVKNAVDFVGVKTKSTDKARAGGFWADMEKTVKALHGWWPGITLEEGIRRTIAAWEAK